MENEKIKKVYRTIMLIIVVALVTFITTSVFLYNKLEKKGFSYTIGSTFDSELLKKIYTIKTIIDKKFTLEVDENKLVESAIKGYVDGLEDEYTEYFSKEEMEEFLTETEGNYVGIGIYMFKNTDENNIVVLYPIEGSPAEKVGIQAGDIIKKVDGVECNGDDFETISTKIKGKAGTKVNIEIERNNESLSFEIERKKIDLYPIKSEILENNIGYIKLTSFDEGAAKEFKETYKNLNKSNIKRLIIDLRNNGGGIFDEAIEIADYILDKDQVIVITKDKEGNEEIEKSSNKPIINIPIVVLTNSNSASASEILVAALKENNKATIVGEKTYGKGVIQELITLKDGSGIKITTEEYYTPNKKQINKLGIEPDTKVSLPNDLNSVSIERKYDTQLEEAIKILKDR